MTKLSKRAIEALNRNETDEIFLYCLEIEVEGEEAWRFVNNNEDIISDWKRYTACGFTVSLPSQKNETGSETCRLSIDNIDSRIMQFISKGIGKKITAKIIIILADTPDIIEKGPLKFILRNVSVDKATVQGDLYDFYLFDRNIPEGRFTPKDFPGLF